MHLLLIIAHFAVFVSTNDTPVAIHRVVVRSIHDLIDFVLIHISTLNPMYVSDAYEFYSLILSIFHNYSNESIIIAKIFHLPDFFVSIASDYVSHFLYFQIVEAFLHIKHYFVLILQFSSFANPIVVIVDSSFF